MHFSLYSDPNNELRAESNNCSVMSNYRSRKIKHEEREREKKEEEIRESDKER